MLLLLLLLLQAVVPAEYAFVLHTADPLKGTKVGVQHTGGGLLTRGTVDKGVQGVQHTGGGTVKKGAGGATARLTDCTGGC